MNCDCNFFELQKRRLRYSIMVEEFKINKGILYSPLESPRPPPAHCPSPFSDLFTQIHLTFVWFVWLEFFSFFTSRIVDFCWLPFIFTLVHISSVLISYHVCFTLLRFYIQRSQSFSSATFCKFFTYVTFSIATFSLSDQSK